MTVKNKELNYKSYLRKEDFKKDLHKYSNSFFNFFLNFLAVIGYKGLIII